MLEENIQEFNYRIAWRSRNPRPGHHKSTMPGAGQEYRDRAPLLDYPDPRRLDLRHSLTDPFERLFVHVFNQFSAIPVYAIVDLSASMNFEGATDKLALMTEFLAALAFSASRTGDPFGVVGCGREPLPEFFLPATRNSDLALDMLRRLIRFVPEDKSAEGMQHAAPLLAHRKALVFLVSDFHFSDDQLRGIMASLARHELAPIVMWDSMEWLTHAPNGIAHVKDNETGRERTLWIRRATRERVRRSMEERRARLTRLFLSFHCEPFFLRDRVDTDELNRYFARR